MFKIDTGTPQNRYGSIRPSDALADLDPKELVALVIAEMKKPARTATVRNVLCRYWKAISDLKDEHPELFDEVMYEFVAEIEERNASEAGR